MAAVEFYSAEDIGRALKGRRSGPGWIARCVAHDDQTPSLSIRQGHDRVLVHCFSGCSPHAVIAALREGGLWPSDHRENGRVQGRPPKPKPRAMDDAAARTRTALRVWTEAGPISGTIVERYLVEHRGLDIRGLRLAHALRWNPRKHALVGLMTDPITGEPTGVHRTFLDADGAKIERKMLGRQGVVRISPDEAVTTSLGVAEGIEDAIAVLVSGWSPVWAATSAGAIARFPVLDGVEALTVFADADAPGVRAAEVCRTRWDEVQREVRVISPEGVRHD